MPTLAPAQFDLGRSDQAGWFLPPEVVEHLTGVNAGSHLSELDRLLKQGLKGLRMFVFTEAEREIRTRDRAIVLNEVGLEVLVGLTEDETALYMDYMRRYGLNKRLWTRARPDKAEREAFLELHNRHETARLAAFGRKVAARLKSKK